MRLSKACFFPILLTNFAGLVACGPDDRTYRIEGSRSVSLADRDWDWNATPLERFGGKRREPEPAQTDMRTAFNYKVPEGFTELDSSQYRWINLKAGEVECYLTQITGGGMASNLNRWRGQIGLANYTQEELDKLPRRKMLGRDAVVADMSGDFKGMAGKAKKDYRLLGLFAQFPQFALTVKAVGPAAEVAKLEKKIFEFCDSLSFNKKFGKQDKKDTAHGGGGTKPAKDGFNPRKLRWTLPSGWKEIDYSSDMRLATFEAGGKKTTCWVIHLPGFAGGMKENVNRWRREVGQGALSTGEIQNLPKVRVLGKDGVIVEGEGRYQGMSGPRLDKAQMFGLIVPAGQGLLFVKLVGPSDQAKGQRENFLALCKSMRVEK